VELAHTLEARLLWKGGVIPPLLKNACCPCGAPYSYNIFQPLHRISEMSLQDTVRSAFAPQGKLRASINLGNPILANRDPNSGAPGGVSVDLAHAFAQKLGLDIELVVFDTAGKSVEAVSNEQADIGFFAVDPLRGANIAFSAPYVLIEGFYLVRNNSPIHRNDEVDTKSNRVAVGKGSAYDLFLTRELHHATIVRAPSSPTVVQTFIEQGLEVAAGVKQQLEADAALTPGLRLLDERFMVIAQAMGTPKSRGEAAAEYLHSFVEEMKRTGFVEAALARHGINGASVAPSASPNPPRSA
jgi:polar amino acid transport system substrate-binding protein